MQPVFMERKLFIHSGLSGTAITITGPDATVFLSGYLSRTMKEGFSTKCVENLFFWYNIIK